MSRAAIEFFVTTHTRGGARTRGFTRGKRNGGSEWWKTVWLYINYSNSGRAPNARNDNDGGQESNVRSERMIPADWHGGGRAASYGTTRVHHHHQSQLDTTTTTTTQPPHLLLLLLILLLLYNTIILLQQLYIYTTDITQSTRHGERQTFRCPRRINWSRPCIIHIISILSHINIIILCTYFYFILKYIGTYCYNMIQSGGTSRSSVYYILCIVDDFYFCRVRIPTYLLMIHYWVIFTFDFFWFLINWKKVFIYVGVVL